MQRPHSARGFTIMELMISVMLISLLGMAMAAALETQKRFYNTNERVVETQEDVRLVLDLVKQDARMAGFMVPPVAGIASVDGNLLASDRLCLSDSNYFDLPDGATTETTLSLEVEHFHSSNTSQVAAVLPPTQVRVQNLDIDGVLGANDFVIGSGIIIGDGTTSHCAMIAAINVATNTITLIGNHPLPATPYNLANTRAVPAIIYEIITPPPPPGGAPASNLMRNGQLMSSTIEDLQVEFWAPATPAAAPIHNLNDPINGLDPSSVSRLRISVVSRATQTDVGSSKRFGGGQRPAVANRAQGATDSFHRRILVANVRPRNISTGP